MEKIYMNFCIKLVIGRPNRSQQSSIEAKSSFLPFPSFSFRCIESTKSSAAATDPWRVFLFGGDSCLLPSPESWLIGAISQMEGGRCISGIVLIFHVQAWSNHCNQYACVWTRRFGLLLQGTVKAFTKSFWSNFLQNLLKENIFMNFQKLTHLTEILIVNNSLMLFFFFFFFFFLELI